eukprot:TRINITY_DN10638_c0_g1_i1.p1 TRINITY_DN10638_c0_g1~~TRINITY_DN10638_c0_g1_i1.p1  ORF type:complete len:169 (-),score=72.98 TRINITY_DN10638_c0_g1_i1:56-562(-)
MATTEEEYLWSCTLTGTNKEYIWAPGDDDKDDDDDDHDPSVKPGHRLLIKSGILMPGAKDGEVNIVQLESTGYNKVKVEVPICAIKAGGDPMQYIDLLLPHKAVFKLIQGQGPISLNGSHCVDLDSYRDIGFGGALDESSDWTDNDDGGEGDKKVEDKKEDKKEEKKE